MSPADPHDLLDAARRLSTTPGSAAAGLWPRAAALIARQAVEAALGDYWGTTGYPTLASRPMRSQLICLAELAGRPLAGSVAATWSSLSSGCHAHPYELAPTSAELLGWVEDAETLVAALLPRDAIDGHAEAASSSHSLRAAVASTSLRL